MALRDEIAKAARVQDHLQKTSLSPEQRAKHERALKTKLDDFFGRLAKRIVPALAKRVPAKSA